MTSEDKAKFLKEFGPRRDALLERLKKAANVGEGPMSLGKLDILAAASMELLTLALANMPEPARISFSQALLRTKDLGADVRTYKGRKPPKHYPDHIPMMRLDDAYSHSDEWKGTLHDTIAAGRPVSDAEEQDRLIRDAVAAE